MAKNDTTRVIDHNYERVLNMHKKINGAHTKVGFPLKGDVIEGEFEGSKREKIEELSEIALYAAWNEFGTSKMDARPFFSTAFDNAKLKLNRMMKVLYKKILNGTMSIEQALTVAGEFVIFKVKDSINNGNWEPNKQRTIDNKGSSQPLIDHGTMLASVQQQVKMK